MDDHSSPLLPFGDVVQMNRRRLERAQLVRRPAEDVFAFFARADNLERITPPWLRFEVLTAEPVALRAGTVIDYRLRLHGLPLRWTSRIEEWRPGRGFVDRQVRGAVPALALPARVR